MNGEAEEGRLGLPPRDEAGGPYWPPWPAGAQPVIGGRSFRAASRPPAPRWAGGRLAGAV